jgi:hypothetical protein
MLRIGVVAAALVLAGALLVGQGHSAGAQPVQHTCGLTDRQFISNYEVQLTAVGIYGDDYLHGAAGADDVVDVAETAAHVVKSSAPYDPSLRLVRRLAPAMFLEYADAVRARAGGDSAARQMYLAYSIGARVEDALREGRPGLEAAGCDVADLLE